MQLAQNAVQHTNPEDVIEVGSRVVDDQVELWVGDSGPGVPESDRERIFNSFGRNREGASRGEHFGLGLPIVRAVAEAHRGQVKVENANAGGACFRIRVPLMAPQGTVE
jgi:signal transduction histidine kinase